MTALHRRSLAIQHLSPPPTHPTPGCPEPGTLYPTNPLLAEHPPAPAPFRRGYAEETYTIVVPRYPKSATTAAPGGAGLLGPGARGLAAPAGVPLLPPGRIELQQQKQQQKQRQQGTVPTNVVVPEEQGDAAAAQQEQQGVWPQLQQEQTPEAKLAAVASGEPSSSYAPATPGPVASV